MDSNTKGKVIIGAIGSFVVFGVCAITGEALGLWGLCLVAIMMRLVDY